MIFPIETISARRCVSEKHEHCLLSSIFGKRVKFSQGSWSNRPTYTFVWLTETIEIHYHVKLHQNRTSSFRVIGNFPIEKYENTSTGQRLKLNVIQA